MFSAQQSSPIETHCNEIVRMIESVVRISSYDPIENHSIQQRLNTVINQEIHNDPDLFFRVARQLLKQIEPVIHRTLSIEQSSSNLDEVFIETLCYFSFRILENIVKFDWYRFRNEQRNEAKIFATELCCDFGKQISSSPNIYTRISNSNLILNTASRFVTEIFIREWPNNWPNFFDSITQSLSILTIHTFLNFSDYINKLFLPNNPNRRKEITKYLMFKQEQINNYLLQALSIKIQSASTNTDQLMLLKTLEAIESLWEWFPLERKIIEKVNLLVEIIPFNNNEFLYRLRLLSLRSIETLLKRQVKRFEDTEVIEDVYFNLNDGGFTSKILKLFCLRYCSIDNEIALNDPKEFTVMISLLEIIITIACKIIHLFGLETTSDKSRQKMISNQPFWYDLNLMMSTLLVRDNVLIDEKLLRYYLNLSKMIVHHKLNISNGGVCRNETEKYLQSLQWDDFYIDEVVKKICELKIVPKSQDSALDLFINDSLDCYEDYLKFFRTNRTQFILFISNLIKLNPSMRKICFTFLNELMDNINRSNETDINSWTRASIILPALFSKFDYTFEVSIYLLIYSIKSIN